MEEIAKQYHWTALEDPKQSICSLGEKQLSTLLSAKGENPVRGTRFYSSAEKSEVLIAGETHFLTDFKARQALIKMAQEIKGGKACVALELPKTSKGLAHFIQGIRAQAVAERAKGDEWSGQYNDDLVSYYGSMIDYASSLSLAVKSVDHRESFSNIGLDLQIRNQAMAAHIAQLLESQECSFVLLFVGKAHETKGIAGEPAISEILKSKGHTVSSVNLQMSYEKSIPFRYRTFQCEIQNSIHQTAIVDSKQFSEKVRVAPHSQEMIRLRDFDFTWFIPIEDHNYSCASCLL